MKDTTVNIKQVSAASPNGRRNFLKMSGLALAGTGLLIAGCSDDDDNRSDNQLPGVRNGKFDLGGGDAGILTYAYALEQLEADFYTRVVNNASFTATFNAAEQAVLVDLYNHEVIHREFFKAAITGALSDAGGGTLLPNLEFNYGTLNFANRTAVLQTAIALEDTGVRAYNGAGQYISNTDYLLIAGKIVSVEARHASAVRDLLNGGDSFAGDDAVDATTGLDKAENPSDIIRQVSALNIIQTPFTAQFLR
ncbi:ferritin-like domain-containing protein [Flavobacterium sp. Sd200]|uniref:ferritin-like domain-containing protein n=1 Tax=Flavobacterium sp. Sd200 TaxID=2692211 RepID=UPI00136CC177|nr:ferritin-like domain-containing protein [Flavobacterium sp. Sd200]MXN91444.1 ferritin-like domain-containing protein [Flavobacterium sp. Sd200]